MQLLLALLSLALFPVFASNRAAPAVVLEVVQGDRAIHNIRERTFVEPIVRLTDQGRPVEGAIVTFLVPEIGPGATFRDGPVLTITTGADGQAVGRGLRPNTTTGLWEIRVTASFQGRVARIAIPQVNAAPEPSGAGKARSRTYLILGLVAGSAVAGAVAAFGGNAGAGNRTPAPPVVPPSAVTQSPTVVSPGNGSMGPP